MDTNEPIDIELPETNKVIELPKTNEVIELPGTNESPKPITGINIIEASYGYKNKVKNVKNILDKLLISNPNQIRVSNKILGDPCYSKKKTLKIKYQSNSGKIKKEIINENEYFYLNKNPNNLINTIESSKRPVYIYFHICAISNWKKIVTNSINYIKKYKLYNAVDEIRCCIVGKDKSLPPCLINDPKIKIIARHPNTRLYERFTLEILHKHAQKEKFHGLYLHSKGVQEKMFIGVGSMKCLLVIANII